jgi:hypothetical protein
VQESVGGYLGERDQWFFTLPLELRAAALALRGETNYAKLWSAISRLNRDYGLPGRGHLESILARKRSVLTQFRSRLELVAGQLGALFFLGSRLVGAEIAPTPAYFTDVWPALVCFAYGPAAMRREPVASFGDRPTAATSDGDAEPYPVSTLDELVARREADARERADEVRGWIDAANWSAPTVTEEDRYLHMRLCTVDGERVAGQVVLADERPVYASLFTKEMV